MKEVTRSPEGLVFCLKGSLYGQPHLGLELCIYSLKPEVSGTFALLEVLKINSPFYWAVFDSRSA